MTLFFQCNKCKGYFHPDQISLQIKGGGKSELYTVWAHLCDKCSHELDEWLGYWFYPRPEEKEHG